MYPAFCSRRVDPVSQASPFELSCLEVVLDTVCTKLLRSSDAVERRARSHGLMPLSRLHPAEQRVLLVLLSSAYLL